MTRIYMPFSAINTKHSNLYLIMQNCLGPCGPLEWAATDKYNSTVIFCPKCCGDPMTTPPQWSFQGDGGLGEPATYVLRSNEYHHLLMDEDILIICICSLSWPNKLFLTHWGRVTHICVSKLTILGSDNGLFPGRCQAIIWTNSGIMLMGSLETNFDENLIKIQQFPFNYMHWKMSPGKWRPLRLGLNVLTTKMICNASLGQIDDVSSLVQVKAY